MQVQCTTGTVKTTTDLKCGANMDNKIQKFNDFDLQEHSVGYFRQFFIFFTVYLCTMRNTKYFNDDNGVNTPLRISY